ncbi:phage tail protein [Nodosilinea sp. FACHB-131]|uniref:phage baseplate assembly protein V n=1 Tax=Cyanophyceae TaxID=3028117 RepID=UPI0016858EDD|nr:phage baseplate assembly protein V [Nodosilinea sp. FACHB-131]MBD1873790.1 phage tail protein [Nodosilinea sp. FACHB-131]
MTSTPLAQIIGTPDQGDRFFGVTVGIVTNNQDPKELGRVKLKFPWLSDLDEGAWARVLTPMAGRNPDTNQAYGLHFLPEVDTEVLVAFEQGDIEFPYILGALWNGKDKPINLNSDGKNNHRTLKSRSGHTIQFDDTKDNEKIEIIDGSGKNSIVISTKDNTVTVTGDADILIQSKNGKLKLSGKGIELKSGAEIKVEAQQNLELKAGPQMTLKANLININ